MRFWNDHRSVCWKKEGLKAQLLVSNAIIPVKRDTLCDTIQKIPLGSSQVMKLSIEAYIFNFQKFGSNSFE